MLRTWIFVMAFKLVECSFTVPCGPYKPMHIQCRCTVQLGVFNITKMDCSGRRYDISDMCKSVGFANKMNVRFLDATNNKISIIRSYSEMKGCESLQSLNLEDNSLKWIEKDAFNGLGELKFLGLGWNYLDVYKVDGLYNFSKLSKIETLALHGNTRHREHLLHHSYPTIALFSKLKSIYLDGLTNTPFDMSYANITNLSLSGYKNNIAVCHLGNLTLKTFKYLKHVRNLNLSVCNIENIEAYTFTPFKYLEKLDLSYNGRLGFRSLRNVSYGLQFTNIMYLDYSYVHNTFGLGNVVRKKDLCYLRNSSITELLLVGNNIQHFEKNSLMLLPKMLEVIHLDDNKFTFASYVFQGACAQHIKHVYVSYLSKYHDPNAYFHHDNTNIDEPEVYNDHSNCPYMTDEFLKSISNEIPFCPFFETDNIIPYVPPYFPANVTKLVMHSNNMRNVQPFLVISDTVEYIDLSGNLFYSLGELPIGLFPNLKYLDLSRNYGSDITSEGFSNLTYLEELQISENFLGLSMSFQTGIFDDLPSLRTLNLTSNRITTIPENTFDKLFSLETLDLSANNIVNLNINTDQMVRLTNLNLSYNSIQTLPMSLAEQLAKVSELRSVPFTINMEHNSIKVSCEYETFLKWMIYHRSNFVKFGTYTFLDENNVVIQPSEIQTYVTNLSKSCKSYTLLIVICSIGLSVFLAIVLGGVFYRNRWKLRYMLYMAKGRYNGYIAIPDGEPQHNYKYDAFISYSEDDIRFIMDGIIPKLEEHDFKLCIHQRDFIPGKPIADNIMDAIQNSKMTIVILTSAYLKSKWCVYEFNMARMESMYSRNNEISLLFVMLENVPTKHMPLEMVKWIKDNSYLEYKEDRECELLFWGNLKDALS